MHPIIHGLIKPLTYMNIGLQYKHMSSTPPPIGTIRRLQSDPDRSPQFRAHEIACDRYMLDFHHITEVLDWRNWETRRQLGKAGVRHLLLDWRFYGNETKSRLIGTAMDNKGVKKGFVDLRTMYDASEIDETLDQRVIEATPSYDVIHDGSKRLIEFVKPCDLLEQAQPKYISPYFR